MRVSKTIWPALFAATLLSPLAPAIAEQTASLQTTRWTQDAESTFKPLDSCPELARRQTLYRVCDDQRVLFREAVDTARNSGTLLLVTFGSTWCPSCRSLSAQLEQAAAAPASVARKFTRVEIAVSTLKDGRRIAVPTGEAVLRQVLAAAPAARMRGVPFIAVVDPNDASRSFARNLDDAEVAAGGAFDLERLGYILSQASAHVRDGAAAPSEPGWLRRKLRRWFNI